MGWLDLVFPKRCVNCGRDGGYVCEECRVGLWEEEQICPICRRNSRYGLRHEYCKGDMDGLACLWAFEGIARKLITEAKYKYFYDELKELVKIDDRTEFSYFLKFLEQRPTVVPVPLHPKRLRERGFNQAEIIGRSIASRHLLSFNSHALLRIKETKPQVGKSREERLKAMEGAFTINSNFEFRNSKLPTTVLLVDDVWTTGATMSECAKVLKTAGVKKIWGLVLAR